MKTGKRKSLYCVNPAYLEILNYLNTQPTTSILLSQLIKKSHSVILRQLKTLMKDRLIVRKKFKKGVMKPKCFYYIITHKGKQICALGSIIGISLALAGIGKALGDKIETNNQN